MTTISALEFEKLFNDLSMVGFDSMVNSLRSARRQTSFPPHNLVRVNEDKYIISLALAGFTSNNVTVSVDNGKLLVTGEVPADTSIDYIHKGIANRKFQREFLLSDHMEVDAAGMKDGVLHIIIVRNIPEHKKPKVIPITTDTKNLLS